MGVTTLEDLERLKDEHDGFLMVDWDIGHLVLQRVLLPRLRRLNWVN